MMDKQNKNMDKKQQNQTQPYYQGIIHSIETNPNKSHFNQTKTNRLYSANNSLSKNKKQNGSQDKMKIYKDNNNNRILFNSNNYQTVPGRPTSVKPMHQNFIYQQKRKGGGGIGYSTELNYPCITLNSTNSQVNCFPLQRKRKIIYEEDNELADEYDKLRKIWKEAGVTDVYIDNFETVTNNQNNTKQEILQSLKNEEQQMIKFKEEMLKVVTEIIKRENDIKNIKEINKRYLDINTRININPKKNIKNNKDDKKEENDELGDEKRKELDAERKKIEEEIERCLTNLRLHGINVVAIIKKFNMRYDNLLNAGKIDLDFLKQKYGFDKNYLMKLKTDLDFLKDTDIGDLYHFSIVNPRSSLSARERGFPILFLLKTVYCLFSLQLFGRGRRCHSKE